MWKVSLVGIAALLFAAQPASAGSSWELVEDDDGIKVWSREVGGSNVRQVKATKVVALAPERIWAVLVDTESYVEFMPYLESVEILEKVSASVSYLYQKVDAPLVDARDYVIRVTMKADPDKGVWTRSWVPAHHPSSPPENDDAVRLKVLEGQWTLKRLAPGKTEVTYFLHTDPGGSIPTWIANKANKSSVPTLLSAVAKRSADPNYRRD